MDTNALKTRAQGVMSGFSMGQRAVVIVAVVTLAAGGFAFAQWAAKPTMVPLFTNLASEDASAITTELQSKNVSYELADGGQTVMVPQSLVYQTRIDLAAAGLPQGGAEGYKLLDEQGITTSEFREHIGYQRALQGELSKTIGSIDGVQAATVNLVIPKNDVFSTDERKPTASVLVKTAPGKSLASPTVQAIVNLVAGSVEGLDPADVTVADSSGRVLAAPGQGGIAGNTDGQRQETLAREQQLSTNIQNMLLPVVGQGKAVVTANVQLNWDKSQTTSENWNPNNEQPTALSQRSKTETYEGANPNSTGILGPEGAGAGSEEPGTYTMEDGAQDNAVDREVTQTEKAPGSVDRISVAVLLDSNVANIDAAEITKIVTDAAGLQVARGDTVTVSRLPFDESAAKAAEEALTEAQAAQKQEQMIGFAKTGGTFLIILVVLIILFVTSKRRAKTIATPISMNELEASMPALPTAAEMLDSVEPIQLDTSPEALERAKIDKQIGDLIERQPDEVAQLLRSWLADRRG